jgi:hypothetical protein
MHPDQAPSYSGTPAALLLQASHQGSGLQPLTLTQAPQSALSAFKQHQRTHRPLRLRL